MFLYSSLLARNQYIASHSMRASTERITMRIVKRYPQANKKCWVTLFPVMGCYGRSQCNLLSHIKEPHTLFLQATHQWFDCIHCNIAAQLSSRDSHNRPPYSGTCPCHTDWHYEQHGLSPRALGLGNALDEWCLLLFRLA